MSEHHSLENRHPGRMLYPALSLFFLAMGIFLRLHMLGAKSLWLDEASSVTFARQPWLEFLRTMWYGEVNMAFYYFVLRGWLHLGDTEFWLRSLSALFGVAALAATYFLGKRFLSPQAGFAAAALLAVNSFHIQYSQELRSYSLIVLLLVLSASAFLAAMETPHRSHLWVIYAVLSALAIYTQVFAVFVIASQWLVLTPGRIKRLGFTRLFLVAAGLSLMVTPVAAVLVLENKGQIDWVPRPSGAGVFDVLQNLSGTVAGAQVTLRGVILLALYGLVWALAVVGALRGTQDRDGKPATNVAVSLLISWLAFPLAAMLLVSFAKPIFYPRYLLMCVPAVVLLAGQGLAVLYQQAKRTRLISSVFFVAMIFLSALGTRDYFASFRAYGHDWRAVTNYVLSNQQPGDAAIFYTFSGHRVFEYYATREREEGQASSSPDILFPLRLDRAVIEKREQPYRRIWFVVHQTRSSAVTDEQTRMIRSALETHFQLLQEKTFPGAGATRGEDGTITVALYAAALPVDR
jgi:mannosyltransferase